MHLDVCLIIGTCAGRFGLVLPMMQVIFCTSHVHAYFMRTYPFISLFLVVMCFLSLSLSLPLSLTQINYVWHLSANPLRLETLLVPGLLLLILLFPLFMFGSVIGRPNKTSLRTFRNVAFIRSAMLFCWTFLTLLSLWSFGLEAGNLFVRDP